MSAPAPTRSEALAHLSPRVAEAVAEAKAGLEALYGDRLARVVLYGSQARGDARPDSDVDILVVLHGEVRPYDEIKRTGDIRLHALLNHDAPASIQPYSLAAYLDQPGSFMSNVRREGVEL